MRPLTDHDIQSAWPSGFLRQRELEALGASERRFLAVDERIAGDTVRVPRMDGDKSDL